MTTRQAASFLRSHAAILGARTKINEYGRYCIYQHSVLCWRRLLLFTDTPHREEFSIGCADPEV